MAGLPGPHPAEGSEPHPQWYAYVCYAVPADLLIITSDIGVDRNMGRCKKRSRHRTKIPTRTARAPAHGIGAIWHGSRKGGNNRRHRVGYTLRKLHRQQARGPR